MFLLKEYFRCSKDGIFTDVYGCDNGRYLECVYYGQSKLKILICIIKFLSRLLKNRSLYI